MKSFLYILLLLGAPPAEVDNASFYLGNANTQIPRSCRSTVGTRVHTAYGQANQLKASYDAKAAKALMREVGSIVRLTERRCSEATKALGFLRQAHAELRSLGATIPDPVAAPRCWHAADPGCLETKNGHPPMGKRTFELLVGSMQATRKLHTMKSIYVQGVSSHYLTAMQLTVIVDLFIAVGIDDVSLVGVLQTGVPRVVDPEGLSALRSRVAPGTASARYLGVKGQARTSQPEYEDEPEYGVNEGYVEEYDDDDYGEDY